MVWGSLLLLKRFACTAVRSAPKTSSLRASKLLSSCPPHRTQALKETRSQSPSIAPRYKASFQSTERPRGLALVNRRAALCRGGIFRDRVRSPEVLPQFFPVRVTRSPYKSSQVTDRS